MFVRLESNEGKQNSVSGVDRVDFPEKEGGRINLVSYKEPDVVEHHLYKTSTWELVMIKKESDSLES